MQYGDREHEKPESQKPPSSGGDADHNMRNPARKGEQTNDAAGKVTRCVQSGFGSFSGRVTPHCWTGDGVKIQQIITTEHVSSLLSAA